MESGAIGHFIFDEVAAVWKRKSPTPHAASKVWVELDRSSYLTRTRTREIRKPINAWSFPDCRAQVCMMPQNMVSAMGGSLLVVKARLKIKDAGGHELPVDGAVFVIISRVDKRTGLLKSSR